MKYIFLIAAFNSLFFIVLLSQKKPKALHDDILIWWLTYLGFYISIYTFYSHQLFTNYSLLSISLISLLMLHGPLLYLYIQALVTNRRKLLLKDIVHLIPFGLFNQYIFISSFSPESSEKLNIERLSGEYNPPLLFLFFLIATALSGTVYILLTIRLFRKLDIRIFNNYSYSSELDLKWLRRLVIVFGIIWTILIGITVIHHVFGLFSMVFCTDGLFLSLSVFVILIGYYGLKQKVIFSSEDLQVERVSPEPQARYAGSRLSQAESDRYADRLKKYMKSSQPHLNPELTLAQLAAGLGISGHVLSQVINEKFGVNFFDFINDYRVESFKEKIADPKSGSFS
jgi:AraC-like DNA-binding protein